MKLYMKELQINDVRGLSDIKITIEPSQHLILTGKNGSGKTSVLNVIANYLNELTNEKSITHRTQKKLDALRNQNSSYSMQSNLMNRKKALEEELEKQRQGIAFSLNVPDAELPTQFAQGGFIIAYYRDHRVFDSLTAKHIEKVVFPMNYSINAIPRQNFVKFLLDLKATAGMAGKSELSDEITRWFADFENLLKTIFEDESLTLNFDINTYAFSLKVATKPAFDFNTLSSGYGAVLDIVVDLMMRMQNVVKRKFAFHLPGIVLIDEIETHLHIDLQKNVMPLLTKLFPNIQFIITTHSPFILNALENVVIYDLKNKLLVENG